MKKAFVLLLTVMMLMSAVPALAADTDYQYFAPYSELDVNIFKEAGFSCYFDTMKFTAELGAPAKIEKSSTGIFSDTQSISFDLRMILNNGSISWMPRMIVKSSGFYTTADSIMEAVYMKAGENRYAVTVDGVTRTLSKSTASETGVIPIGLDGLAVLEYLTTTTHPVTIRFNSDLRTSLELTAEDISAIKTFIDTCKKAGVFAQTDVILYNDNFTSLTLFNKD